MEPRDQARLAFLAAIGWDAASVEPLPGDASFRRYFRLRLGAERAMLMDAPPPREDVGPFLAVAGLLRDLGYSAPAIFARDRAQGFLAIEDLGDDTFTRLLGGGADETGLYTLATDLLADLHDRFEPARAAGLPAYDDDRLLAEAGLFVHWFVPAALGAEPSEEALESWAAVWRDLMPALRAGPQTLVLRDYHVDNLMRLPRPGLAACGLLDFQDAVLGPVAYDLMSLVEDARRFVPIALAAAMRDRYLAARPGVDPDGFARSFALLAAQRHAKVIGIFCRLAKRDGKPRYLGHLPHLWRLFERALADPVLAPLADWVDRHVPVPARGIPRQLVAS